ncbi:hypothetical protein EYF80_013876 [Liparis tanakae]|uniref:Uncharacterized protein n=1 Tax=Liparis tanakae TaxID=230148 RepID=A0A4Z2ID82_9TELE|nr:hypothetical protein EYF80_013876 [Liparis tanakae]
MTAKKAQTDTMTLLVVPLGFCTGTELLNTRPHSSQMAFPMVKEGPDSLIPSVRGSRSETHSPPTVQTQPDRTQTQETDVPVNSPDSRPPGTTGL